MLRLEHHDHPNGIEHLLDRVGDLTRHTFLHLQPAGKTVDETSELGQSRDPTVSTRDVADVGATDERKEVVLTHRRERDVADQHDFVVVRFERCREMLRRVLTRPCDDLREHTGDSSRGRLQTVAIGILPDRDEQLAHRRSGSIGIYTSTGHHRIMVGRTRSRQERTRAEMTGSESPVRDRRTPRRRTAATRPSMK